MEDQGHKHQIYIQTTDFVSEICNYFKLDEETEGHVHGVARSQERIANACGVGLRADKFKRRI